jgi:predicted Zn-dependent peptidase
MKILLRSALALSLSLAFIPTTLSILPTAIHSAQAAAATLPVEHFTLENGLKVYLSRNTQTPRFYAQIVINAGGKHDPSDATGIAHYLEHMLFKGTSAMGTRDYAQEKALLDQITALYEQHFNETDEQKRLALQKQINQLSVAASQFAIPGEMDSLYSRLGGEGLNAYTSNEETVYLIDLPKNRLEQWAKIESERFREPVFRLFQSELETVYEEKNRSLDNKESILYEAVEAQLYKKHPYGSQTILGSVEHLKNPSLQKMYEFYRRYYVPNNMAIVLSGDIDLAQARKLITQHFSTWKKQDVPPFQAPQEAPIQGVERVHVNYKGEEKVTLAFRTVPYGHKDHDALTMLDMLLDSGKVGQIRLNLVQPQKVRAAGSYPQFHKDYGAQYLYAVPREGQSLEEAEKLLLEQIAFIKQGKFDAAQLEGIVLDYETGLKGQMESNEGRGGLMAQAFLHGKTVEQMMQRPEQLKRVRKEDIVRVAQEYFGNNYVAGYRHDKDYTFPAIAKPNLEPAQLNPNQQSAFAQQVESIATAAIDPRWVDYQKDFKVRNYDLGVLQYHVKNPINDLFSFSVSYEFGDKQYPGFCSVMDELNFAGTGKMSAADVQNAFFRMGVNAHFGCSDYGFYLSLSGLDSKFEQAVALSEQVLWNGQLDETRFQAKIANQISNRIDQKKDVNTLRRALNSWVNYGEESGYLDRPSAAELKQLSTSQYGDMVTTLKKQNYTLSYMGQLPMDRVTSIVRRYHQPKQLSTPLLPANVAPPTKYTKREQGPVKIYFLDFPGAQSHISLLKPAQARTLKTNDMPLALYNQYMDGGMGAVMFQEVREARSLAYSTWLYGFSGSRLGDQGAFQGYIGTQADKTLESLRLFIDLLNNPPQTENHFQRAQRALENSYRTSYIGFRDVLGSVIGWSYLGYDKDPRPEQFAQLNNLKLTDVSQVVDQHMKGQPLTFTIVGDKNKIDLKALAQIGQVEEVPVAQLFRD